MKLVRLKKSAHPPLPPAPIRIFLGDGSFELASPTNTNFYRRLKTALRHIPEAWGIRLPEIEFCHQPGIPSQAFSLEVDGLTIGEGQLQSGRVLALGDSECLGPLLGEADVDCIYGLPGKWILPTQASQAQQMGCLLMDPESILMTLLMERLPGQLHNLINSDEVTYLLGRLARRQPKLVEEASSRLAPSRILSLLRSLLQEKVSIARLDLILQGALSSHRKKPGEEVVELARHALAKEICLPLCDEGLSLTAMVLAKWLERRWITQARSSSVDDWFLLRFGLALELEMESCWAKGRRPVMIVNPKIRPEIAELFRRSYPLMAVLSWAEVPAEVSVETVAILGSQVHPLAASWNRKSYVHGLTKRRRL